MSGPMMKPSLGEKNLVVIFLTFEQQSSEVENVKKVKKP
jgi:hypothetical protein